jgi:hypothetical protein
MSRTDAHRPYRVWLADHPEFAIAKHRHAARACDLPTVPGPADTHCRWVLSQDAPRLCCCELCHGSAWRRFETRSRRQRDRLLLLLRPTDPGDWCDIEVRLGRH